MTKLSIKRTFINFHNIIMQIVNRYLKEVLKKLQERPMSEVRYINQSITVIMIYCNADFEHCKTSDSG